MRASLVLSWLLLAGSVSTALAAPDCASLMTSRFAGGQITEARSVAAGRLLLRILPPRQSRYSARFRPSVVLWA